ncbi:MAG: acyl-CoA dehydrogenase [Pseudomonadales bacterium]|nr:MAG: acyl-CoA dehydrogenase [Pseudomonadales bacterium]
MTWQFETDPEFQEKLDWTDTYVREEVEPLGILFRGQSEASFDPTHEAREFIKPLQGPVKKRGLWACHLTPELGGQGYGQVKLALMNEILGRSLFASNVFGTMAPDTGNAELLAHFGTEEQKEKYLKPLLNQEITSCFSMTEPAGGADPKTFTCKAVKEGDEYVISGEKWFSSHASFAEFLLVMLVTDDTVPIYEGASIILVPRETPGLEIIRDVGLMAEPLPTGKHAHLRFNSVRVPAENCIGGEGKGFKAAQVRLGGGRVHHAMRAVATAKQAFDMLCERALSRFTQGTHLSDKQMVQDMIAESYIQIQQFRLHTLYTAWLIDKHQEYNREVRKEIAAVKVATETVLHDVVLRSIRIHGSLGMSNLTPLARMWSQVPMYATQDGPTEVHKVTIAKQVLKDYEACTEVFPDYYLPHQMEHVKQKYGDRITPTMLHNMLNA